MLEAFLSAVGDSAGDGVRPARQALSRADRQAAVFAAYPSGFVLLDSAKSEYKEVSRARLLRGVN